MRHSILRISSRSGPDIGGSIRQMIPLISKPVWYSPLAAHIFRPSGDWSNSVRYGSKQIDLFSYYVKVHFYTRIRLNILALSSHLAPMHYFARDSPTGVGNNYFVARPWCARRDFDIAKFLLQFLLFLEVILRKWTTAMQLLLLKRATGFRTEKLNNYYVLMKYIVLINAQQDVFAFMLEKWLLVSIL